MQVLKTLKRVAAIGTGVAMLGATLTGALALDLKDYPAPFVSAAGVYDDSNVFVYGDSAIAADTVAISDISTSLQFMAKTPVATSGGTVSVTGGKAQKLPLGQGFANATYLDKQLQDDDISTLFDGKINFAGTEYDTSEELQFCDASEPYVATSLMTGDDDYKRDVFFELSKDKVRYAYRFDKTINLSVATTTQPVEIEFLGKKLKLTSVTATGFTARVGDEYSMNAGDSVTIEGKTVKLTNVGTSNAVVDVDGVTKSITSGNTATVNGVEVTIDSVTSRNDLAESSAILVMGKQATETYADADAYVGENVDDPNWVWDLRALTSTGTSDYTDCGGTDLLVMRVENDFEMTGTSDKPTGVDQCFDLPNKYLSVCFDSLSVADADYKDYQFEFKSDVNDIVDAGCANTGLDASADTIPAIYLSATGVSEAFDLRALTGVEYNANVSSNVKSNEVWLYSGDGDCEDVLAGASLSVFYKPIESGAKVKFYGAFNSTIVTGNTILRINNGNTKDDNMKLLLMNNATTGTNWTLKLYTTADTPADLNAGSESLQMQWGMSALKLDSLGDTYATEEAQEVKWNPAGRFSETNLGTKDEDHRLGYGTIVINQKGSSSNDKVKLLIPTDIVQANLVVKGTNAKVTSGSTSYVPTKVSPVHMSASKVAAPTSYNLIVVGGPCANPLAESVFGQTCSGWAYKEGEALVKLMQNGEKVALLVAGTSALDTQRAGKALAAYDMYAFSGTEMMVKGATLSDITVEKPTVAAPVVAEEPVAAE